MVKKKKVIPIGKRKVKARRILKKQKPITVKLKEVEVQNVLDDKQRFFTGQVETKSKELFFK